MNPLTPLTFAACAAIMVLAVDSWILSAVVVGAVFLSTPRRVLLPALAIGLPACLGFVLMYAPFGEQPGWWIITRDGLSTALHLGIRFLAVTAVALLGMSKVDVDRLMRALQPRVPAPLLYVVGSTVRLYPMARQRLQTIQQVHQSRGIDTSGIRAKAHLVLPLIVGLVDDAAQRARPLQHLGVGERGPRTVLHPVADSALEKFLRWGALLLTAAVVVWALGWAP
ncbi:energy-coupling factor transporter transmembrane component T family protein [Corynebacterium suicordis]|uniref:energy-coupling factor transporter transmembrane component T family protein n=1 Tax=uncultured Corynebacterium sp. TaxID=159447 RepID=UPI002597146B|nr:energy-coupling factor transporter transmembrane component T [uncultured Corynebacterium sp.]